MRFAVDPFAAEAIMTEFPQRLYWLRLLYRSIFEARGKGLRGQPLEERSLTVLSHGVAAQFDGEVVPLEPDDRITLRHLPRQFLTKVQHRSVQAS